ncbi:hypothetical protein [Mycobacterium avium]|uniref:hypothetical protein n=1 Tax=Mycobacterium avium TaxID=1764 RepID=UPI0009FC3047|nr:hypothetical protein [Mycobacterium avium]
MSDALQTILADPELQQWPNRDTGDVTTVGTSDIDGNLAAHGVEEIDAAAPDDRAAAINKIRALIEPAEDSPGALGSDSGDRGHRDSPSEPPPVDPNSGDDSHRDDPTDSAADINLPEDSPEAPSTAMSFNDIARRPNAIADRFAIAKDWLKDAQNWKNPKILGAAAAGIIGVAALGVWATSATQPAPQPTAQLGAPTSDAKPAGAPTSPAEAAIPIKAAKAHCPAPSSDPMNAVRPGSDQPWICVRAWQIDGQILELTLDGPNVVTAVRILPGVDSEIDGQDQWLRYRTVSRGLWSFDDPEHTKVPQVTGDRRELLTQPVAPASCASKPNADCHLVASHVWLTIVKTNQPANPNAMPSATGTGADDFSAFGVSRIEIIGHPAR